MENTPVKPIDASALLQIGMTIAAVSVALATFGVDEGPAIKGFHILPPALLIAGLVSLYASLHAMAALWNSVGMSIEYDVLGGNSEMYPHLEPSAYSAIVTATWGMWSVTALFIIQLYTTSF